MLQMLLLVIDYFITLNFDTSKWSFNSPTFADLNVFHLRLNEAQILNKSRFLGYLHKVRGITLRIDLQNG